MTRTHHNIAMLACVMLTASCSGEKYDIFSPQRPDLIDPAMQLTRNDYKSINDPKGALENGGKPGGNIVEPPIPPLAEILATPKPPKLGETQLVSVAVTDDVPLKDVLIELARLADVDIEVDAGITGGISFRAKDRPFDEVIARIADLAGLRYSMKNNVLRVERDTPYVQIYSLDFLNLDRGAQSSVNISTSVLSSSGGSGGGGGSSGGGSGGGSSGGGGGGLDNGSSSTITSKADSDFWKQFEESIKRILKYKEPRRVSDTGLAEQAPPPPAQDASPAQPQAPIAPAAASPVAIPGSAAAGGSGGAASQASTPAAAQPLASDTADSGVNGVSTGSGGGNGGAFYILSRQASTLTISATDKQHAMIKEFIKRIQANASSQVLIEAKIVEVTLNDQFQSGIDWTKLGNSKVNFASTLGAVTDAANVATFTANTGKDLDAVVKLAEVFGATRTLSSPRLHAINNQEAVLTFADNQVYFSLTVTQTQSATTTVGTTGINTITVNSTPHTVPIGIILSLQPSINSENDEVTLSVRPTLSRINGTVNDPAVAFTLAQAKAQGIDVTGISSAVPIVEVREMDSILKLKSGQVMVIGGLMQDTSNNTDTGVPGAASIPWIGNLFKGINRQNQTSELVIFIRATVVGTSGNADNADKNVYEKFTKDPRPINF